MTATTRRIFLAGSASAPLIMPAAEAMDVTGPDRIAADLDRYIAFGTKQSGGPGDEACGAWLEAELASAGYDTQRQYFSAPWFEAGKAEIVVGDTRAAVWPQPMVQTTRAEGITARIVRVDAQGMAAHPVAGAIALVELPYARWSSMFWDGVARPVRAAFDAGALACVIVTNGPTRKVIALNTDGRQPLHDRPVALLAPEDAAPFLAAAMANREVTLTVTGQGGRRPAFNLIGRMDRGIGRWLVVSTPRSGWFTCAGERGGGIAAWLHLARWASRTVTGHDLAFVCNSGHEYQHLGVEELLHEAAPAPDMTAFWLHLGATLAARDWHEGVASLTALPGTDSQRYLAVSPQLVEAARREFAGLAGLEAPYSSDILSAGELTNIMEAGYAPVAGVFGVHRFHHVAEDDARCVQAQAVRDATLAFQRLVAHVLD